MKIVRLVRTPAFPHRSAMLAAFRDRRVSARLLALAIIVGALLLRVLVPQGWMPVETAQGWSITICTGTGPMRMDMPGMASTKGMRHGPGDRDHGADDHPCAFSGLSMALDEPQMPVLVLPRLVITTLGAMPVAAVTVGHGLAAPPPLATGPPSLS